MKIIVAQDRKGAIGMKGGLLASIPSDMKHFKEKTMGGTVVMGRKTLESFPGGRPLPGRRNIVLSTKISTGEGYEVCRSREELLKLLDLDSDSEDVFVIGGGEIYRLLENDCDTAIVTEMDEEFEADTFIKVFAHAPEWKCFSRSEEIAENGVSYSFVEYRRI